MVLDNRLIAKAPKVSESRLYQNLVDLCSIGCRWSGTAEEADACEYMRSEMEPYVDGVAVQEFEYPHYTPTGSQVASLKPSHRSFPSVGLEYAASGCGRGRLIYVGEGTEKDFQNLIELGCGFGGTVVLAKTNRPYVVGPCAERNGAAGLIVISDSPHASIRQITSQMGFDEEDDLLKFGISIPGAIIDSRSGDYLLSLLSSGPVEVSVEHRCSVELRKSWNVIGSLQGSEKSEIIIGAHYDTQLGIQGAWDNASGCSALLEILRACSRTEKTRSMRFCAFGCEEIGLFGSTHYVHHRKNELEQILCYINLDSTSADVCTTHELLASTQMLGFAREIIESSTGWEITKSGAFSPSDHEQDAAEFVRQGVNAIWTHEEGNPYFHTSYDTLETIDSSKLARATQVSLLLFYYLSMCGRGEFGW